MHLRLLALSDTHLGEDTSILSFPRGRQALWLALREAFGEGTDPQDPAVKGRFTVDELILMGDIPDRTLSSTSEITTHTNAFSDMLGSACRVKRAVYVPGNHDHTLWSVCVGRWKGAEHYTTPAVGEALLNRGERCDLPQRWGEQLLEVFFGYPGGSSWRAIVKQRKLDFLLANPVYATRAGDRTYVFTHGSLFRTLDVAASQERKRLIAEALRVGLHLKVKVGLDAAKAVDMADLERRAQPFIDTLWPSAGNDPTTDSDRLWAVWVALSGRFGHKRPAPRRSRVYGWSDLPAAEPERIARLTKGDRPRHESLKTFQRIFLPHLPDHLARSRLGTDRLTLVYGDTHTGGWGELHRDGAEPIRVLNTGAWAVDNAEDHPPCQVFALCEDGRECLLDVTVGPETVGGEPLLKLAAEAAEHRHAVEGRLIRAVLRALKGTE
jgi:hypothetical protein